MGLFSQKQQEPSAWAALPGEPLDDRNPNERLDEAPPVDLLGLGGTQSTTVVIPAEPASAAPDDGASAASDDEASDEAGDGGAPGAAGAPGA